jgi:hypothetical protein
MKLAVIYNQDDHKLLPSSYSWTYRDMLLAIMERFAPVQVINESCEASTIEADAILFWDIHSSHHVEIKGIDKHPAVKLEFFNDPHQQDQKGAYSNGQKFHKLGSKQRFERAQIRGVEYIICPYRECYKKYIEPYAGKEHLIWFPVAPKNRIRHACFLSARRSDVLASGHLWQGTDDFKPYEFRNWAYKQPGIIYKDHSVGSDTPNGNNYQAFLSLYAGALALCDCYVVPKYLEIPLAGCVCFCRMLDEYKEMGFEDGVNCIAVTKDNFNQRISEFLADPVKYQSIADAGRELVAAKYTAEHFAEFLWQFLKEKV